MTKRSEEAVELEEQLIEARAQIDALQSAAADAEARSATAREELAGVLAARDSAQGELAQTREELEASRSQLRAAAVRHREAKLATLPELPQELVPSAESLDDIDAEFEAAQRVVTQLREKMQDERQSARVPAGAPPRRAQDMSALSATEKIRLGIEERDRWSG